MKRWTPFEWIFSAAVLIFWGFVIAICASAMAGCSASRKLATTQHETSDYTAAASKDKRLDSTFRIDTTKISDKEITYTKVEFYPPERDKWVILDSIFKVASEKAWEDALNRRNAPPKTLEQLLQEFYEREQDSPPSGGGLKSIEQLNVKTHDEQGGTSEEEHHEDEHKETDLASTDTATVETTEEPAPDPHRWRYIFYTLALGFVIFLFVRRSTIGMWLQKIWRWIIKVIKLF